MIIEKSTYRIYIDKYGYVRVELLGNQTEKDLVEFKKDIVEICQAIKGKKLGMLDVGKTDRVDLKARVIYMEIGRMEMWDKIAIFDGSIMGRVLAKFIIAAINLDRVKFFKTEDEAVKWLRE